MEWLRRKFGRTVTPATIIGVLENAEKVQEAVKAAADLATAQALQAIAEAQARLNSEEIRTQVAATRALAIAKARAILEEAGVL